MMNVITTVIATVAAIIYLLITARLLFKGIFWAPDPYNSPIGRWYYVIWPLWLIAVIFLLVSSIVRGK